LLDIVAEAGIACSNYANGIIAERWLALLRRIDANGHSITAHAWAQNLLLVYQDRETVEEELIRGIAAFDGSHGERPYGFISPRATNSANTLELLAKHGFRWTVDFFDADLPYLIQTAATSIAGVPFTVEVNDLSITLRYGNEPAPFTATLRRILEGWGDIGRPYASFDITAHAHVFGRPASAIEFKAAIVMVKAPDWVWISTHERLAGLVLDPS